MTKYIKIKGYYSRDTDINWEQENAFEKWIPEDPTDVYFWASVYIGPIDSEASDFYDFCVCTPSGFNNYGIDLKNNSPELMKYVYFFDYYTFEELEARLKKILEECDCEGELSRQACLSKYLKWEYENKNNL